MVRDFHVVVERDAEGFYVASVPRLPGCHTQARTREELTQRIQEAIELWLEVEGQPPEQLDFVEVQHTHIGG
ncbi:MAG: type II toxin-antitoxin system HicB family antitoxin [Bryobacterales bacterium]